MSLRQRPFRRSPVVLSAVLCLAAVPTFALADQVVYFTNGKAMTVKKVEKGDKLTILEIEGGGRIGIPTLQIDRVEELSLSPTTPNAPTTQVTALIPPQPTVAEQQPAPKPQAPSAPMPAGPGTGGHPMAQSDALKAGAKPLAVGPDDPEEAAHPNAAAGAQSHAQGQSTTTGTMGPQMNRGGNMMMGGPGSFQRNRNGRGGNNNYARGRLPAGAYLNPGSAPSGAPNGTNPGQPNAAGQPNAQAGAPGQPNTGQPAAGQQGGASQPNSGSQSGANQQAQSGQPAQQPAPQPTPPPPPPAATTPPPPPPDPEPAQGDDSQNSDSSDDGGSTSSDDEPSSGNGN